MISVLKQALTAHPFEPVTVVTSDGASVIISHPDFAAVLRRVGVLYVELPEEPEGRFISLRLIKEVRSKSLTPHGLEDDEESSEQPPPFS